MSPQDLANEKLVVQAPVTKFWKAYEQKDLATITKLLSNVRELTFFGTDSAEVIKSLAEWEALMKTSSDQTLTSPPLSRRSRIRMDDYEQ